MEENLQYMEISPKIKCQPVVFFEVIEPKVSIFDEDYWKYSAGFDKVGGKVDIKQELFNLGIQQLKNDPLEWKLYK